MYVNCVYLDKFFKRSPKRRGVGFNGIGEVGVHEQGMLQRIGVTCSACTSTFLQACVAHTHESRTFGYTRNKVQIHYTTSCKCTLYIYLAFYLSTHTYI
jgi:hypothetical protein